MSPKYIFSILITLFLTVSADCLLLFGAQPAGDTLYTLDGAYALAGRNSVLANQILDSLERQHSEKEHPATPPYQIILARAFVASRDLNPHLALRYLRTIINTPELLNDPKTDLSATTLMYSEYQVLNRHDKMLSCMLLCLDKARKYKNRVVEAATLLGLGKTYGENGEHIKALEHIHEAQRILRKQTDNKENSEYLPWSIELEADIYFQAGNYPDAIRIILDLIAWYDCLTPEQRAGTGIESDRELNYRQAQNRIMLAKFLVLSGNDEDAARQYDRAQQLLMHTNNVLSAQMHELILDYLKAANRYPEALHRALQYLKEVRVGDTINLFNLNAKKQLSDIYQHLGDYPQAWSFSHQASVLSDSLHVRANYEIAIELQVAYETAEKQTQILRQQITITRTRTTIIVLLLGVVSQGAILWLLWHNGVRIRRRNRQLFEQIIQLSDAQEELDRIRLVLREQTPQQPADCDDQLYASIDRLMREQKYFLNPNLTREQVADELGTNKLYISRAISKHCAMTFLEYTNWLRLECAKTMLLYDHTTKIEAIATSCGFSTVRTFYRLFQKHYRLTPSEFRRVAASYDKQPL